MNPELQAVRELQAVVQQLHELAPAPRAGQAEGAGGGPQVHDVLAGLGYLVALQKGARLAGAADGALEVLQSVVHEWLAARKPEPQSDRSEQAQAMSGFYARTSEHIQRLGGSRRRRPRPEEEAADPFP